MEKSNLRFLFSQLADDELAGRVTGGGLTEQAHAIAVAELLSRGLPIPNISQAPQKQVEEYLGDMVILERGMSATEAHLLCAYLQTAGIHAHTGDTNFVQTYGLLAIAVGGASVRVPQSQLAEARETLLAFQRGDFAIGDDFTSDDQPTS